MSISWPDASTRFWRGRSESAEGTAVSAGPVKAWGRYTVVIPAEAGIEQVRAFPVSGFRRDNRRAAGEDRQEEEAGLTSFI